MKKNSRRFVRKQNQPTEKSRSPFFNLAHDESKQHTSFFQTQLKTGEKGDKYEKEADNAAEKVTNKVPLSPEPAVQKQDISAVQMSSLKENEEKAAQKMEKEEEQKPVQKAEKKEEDKPVQKMGDDKEEKPVQKEEKKEDKPIQKAAKEEEQKPVQKMGDDKEEKPVQKEEKKEEEKPVQKAEKKEEDKPVQKAEAEEKEVQPKHEEKEKNEHPPIMRKDKEGAKAEKSSDIAERIKKTKGKGQPMAEKTTRQMEQAFGADFSNVNIHTDEQAASLNKDLHSIAFTNGSDIYFAEGQYNPDSSSGQTLLAHELTHVIQQTGK